LRAQRYEKYWLLNNRGLSVHGVDGDARTRGHDTAHTHQIPRVNGPVKNQQSNDERDGWIQREQEARGRGFQSAKGLHYASEPYDNGHHRDGGQSASTG
jgi:hypothetical protein